jgi:predicted transcriptional regulator of viral defense system
MTTLSAATRRVENALPQIREAFDALGPNWHSFTELRKLYQWHQSDWRLKSVSFQNFLAELIDRQLLTRAILSLRPTPVTRYGWGNPSTLALAQSLSRDGYFSHYSAIDLHGLTREVPKTIYFNIEQTKAPGSGTLTQAGIDKAFSSKAKQRFTKNIAVYDKTRICVLEGANTGNLGVVSLGQISGGLYTNLERTLIDAAVRPAYCGGVSEVVKTYRAAKDHSPSANKIAAYLKQIGYTYPYHQSIGFYMQVAGYAEAELRLLERLGTNHDFYLDYGIVEKEYDSRWRLFYPKGTKRIA